MRYLSLAGVVTVLLGFVAVPVDPAAAQFLARTTTDATAGDHPMAWDKDRHRPISRPHRHHRDRSPFLFRHRHYSANERDRPGQENDARVVPPAPPPAPMPVVVTPPDPQGPLRLTLARGVAAPAAGFELGQALALSQPHVTLDWRRFDLPEPPAGRIYGRVGRSVLLITVTDRIVEAVLPPG